MFTAYDWKIPVAEWFKLPHDQRSVMVATVVARNLIDATIMRAANEGK